MAELDEILGLDAETVGARITALDNSNFKPSRGGKPLYMSSGPDGYFWNGKAYVSEAAMLAASGGARDGQKVEWGSYTDDIDLLGGVDFSSDTGPFASNSGATIEVSGGELITTITGTTAAVRSEHKGYGGRALRFSALCRQIDRNMQMGVTTINSVFGAGTFTSLITNVVATEYSLDFTPFRGNAFWIGLRRLSVSSGQFAMSQPTLKEIWPAKDFPNGNFSVHLTGIWPGSLPAGTEVLFQGDCGNTTNNSRIRVELRSDGSIVLVVALYYNTASEVLSEMEIGTAVAGEPFDLMFGACRSQLVAALDGVSVDQYQIGMAGVSYARIACGDSGEDFSGTVSSYEIFKGCETPKTMERMTAATPDAFTGKLASFIVLNGDSYSETGSTGIATPLEDSTGLMILPLGVGGSTSGQQSTVRAARTDLDGLTNSIEIWYDGSENGFVDLATEQSQISSWVTAMGHDRWIYVRSGQISGNSDMADLYEWVRYTYGDEHVYDPLPVVIPFAIQDPNDARYANDQTDMEAGKFPRSVLYDAVHLDIEVRRSIADDLAKQINALANGAPFSPWPFSGETFVTFFGD